MKKILKWFTLVEILIVIVIIGILIWALVPRMQSAQWRARDVARKNDLSQLQAAIVTSYQDKWDRPWLDAGAANWIDVSVIETQILAAWMNGVPQDPLKDVTVKWLWGEWWEWQYRYMVIDSYWSENWAFVLMAKTEVEWWSNWVVCEDDTWSINAGDDINDLKPCATLTKNPDGSCTNNRNCDNCVYKNEWELRYVLFN